MSILNNINIPHKCTHFKKSSNELEGVSQPGHLQTPCPYSAWVFLDKAPFSDGLQEPFICGVSLGVDWLWQWSLTPLTNGKLFKMELLGKDLVLVTVGVTVAVVLGLFSLAAVAICATRPAPPGIYRKSTLICTTITHIKQLRTLNYIASRKTYDNISCRFIHILHRSRVLTAQNSNYYINFFP